MPVAGTDSGTGTPDIGKGTGTGSTLVKAGFRRSNWFRRSKIVIFRENSVEFFFHVKRLVAKTEENWHSGVLVSLKRLLDQVCVRVRNNGRYVAMPVQVGYITRCRSLRDLLSLGPLVLSCVNNIETSTLWYNLYLHTLATLPHGNRLKWSIQLLIWIKFTGVMN